VIFKKHTPKIILLYNYIINQKTNQANLQNYLKWHYGVLAKIQVAPPFLHKKRETKREHKWFDLGFSWWR
jgi:hypothetical protein